MWKRATLIFALLFSFSACAAAPESPPATEPAAEPSEAEAGGSSAGNARKAKWTGPDFTVTTFDGATFTLAEQAGKPVVLNFWESW